LFPVSKAAPQAAVQCPFLRAPARSVAAHQEHYPNE
jgi:hypothetical protein